MRENRQKQKKWQLKQRIFVMLLVMVLVVFLLIIAAFTFFFQNYIRSNVQQQLDAVVTSVKNLDTDNIAEIREKHEEHQKEDGEDAEEESKVSDEDTAQSSDTEKHDEGRYMPDLSKFTQNKIKTVAHIFNCNRLYTVTDYESDAAKTDAEQIAAAMQEQGISLSDASDVKVETGGKEYYISTIKDPLLPNIFMVFYVDVTDIVQFSHLIGLALGVILIGAMAVCLLLSNLIADTVTRPVKQLSDFAEELGKGNFARREFRFRDREFDELAGVMNQAAQKLEEYDKDQKTFFQNVSHELRTPLMSIRCYAEGIACGVMDAKKSGTVILQETDRLTELVEDLLTISRIDSHTLKLDMQEGDLRDTLALAATGQQALADKKGIAFAYDFDEAAVMEFYHENNMYRAFTNLIGNALRYAHKSVTLTCRKQENQILIAVTDDGDGITQEDLPHVFERFYKGKGGKNGIGLSIVKSIVELHGGSISVTTAPEIAGTSFRILLPVHR